VPASVFLEPHLVGDDHGGGPGVVVVRGRHGDVRDAHLLLVHVQLLGHGGDEGVLELVGVGVVWRHAGDGLVSRTRTRPGG